MFDVAKIIEYISMFLALMLVLPLHEFAHGFAAVKSGDFTPKLYGRYTLNPLAHFDAIGLLCFLFAGFGWAKPVPVNPNNFNNYKKGCFYVSIAGVTANYLLAFLAYPLFVLTILYVPTFGYFTEVLRLALKYVYSFSLSFFVFNLIPVYPLDGFRVVDVFSKKRSKVYWFLRTKGIYVLYALFGLSIIADFTGMYQIDILGRVLSVCVNFISKPITLFGILFSLGCKMAEFESVVDYSTKLDNFEGPIDLLLHLIKKAKIEIKDVFVSQVTEQFLAYMNGVDSLDVDKASEYLNMAATLLEIKSKSILPKVEEYLDDIEDPETALIRQLEEYKLFKEASSKLKEQENVLRFYKEPDKSVGDVKVVYSDFNLDGLIDAFSKLLMRVDDKKRQDNVLKEIPKEVFTVRDKVEHIRTVLLDRKEASFFEMFSSYYTKNELITTFQAMLELLKLQYITVAQNGVFDDITITLREDRNEELGEIDEYN